MFIMEQVLNKHTSVFSDGLDRMKKIQARVQLKESARPRFWKARPVALAHNPAVEEALRELEAEGVIKKVTTSEWAVPIVTPVKKDGSIRVCGDFKDEWWTNTLFHASSRSNPGHSLTSTQPAVCTSVYLMARLQHQPFGNGPWTRSYKVYQGSSATWTISLSPAVPWRNTLSGWLRC